MTPRLRHAVFVVTLCFCATLLFAADYSVSTIALPGGGATGISMDYIAFDAATSAIWVPAGNTGAVDVIDMKSGAVRQISGFPTKEVTVRDRKRTLGPSGLTFGKKSVYIGNRGDSTVCAVDPVKFARGTCETLASSPDGLAFVASTNEVWVTMPRVNSIVILDGTTLHQKTTLTFEGNPEGFAVDGKRNRFYTNLEDKDRTLAIDLTSRKTVATWNPGCGEDGPHGIRLDEKAGHLFVACSARAEVLDVAGQGAVLSSIDSGDGVDDIDYSPATKQLYIGAARAAKLTIARDDAKGHLALVATVPTVAGARNAAVASDGTVYLAHGGGVVSNDIVVVKPPAGH